MRRQYTQKKNLFKEIIVENLPGRRKDFNIEVSKAYGTSAKVNNETPHNTS